MLTLSKLAIIVSLLSVSIIPWLLEEIGREEETAEDTGDDCEEITAEETAEDTAEETTAEDAAEETAEDAAEETAEDATEDAVEDATVETTEELVPLWLDSDWLFDELHALRSKQGQV